MRMRRSVAEFERAFERRAAADREKDEHRLEQAVARTHIRRRDRAVQNGFRRYLVLVAVLAGTVVVVTYSMFQVLAWIMS